MNEFWQGFWSGALLGFVVGALAMYIGISVVY